MKKFFSLIAALICSVCLFSGCEYLEEVASSLQDSIASSIRNSIEAEYSSMMNSASEEESSSATESASSEESVSSEDSASSEESSSSFDSSSSSEDEEQTDSSSSDSSSSGGSDVEEPGYRVVDFTAAQNVKNVSDQGYYEGGCPTLSTATTDPAVLVIPVEFSDIRASSKGYTIANIEKVFNGDSGSTDYYSVWEYYYLSSYGKLDLNITVLDTWFCPENPSSYYKNATMDYYGEDTMIGDQIVMDEALKYLSSRMDLSQFDTDNNSMIDAVVLITTLDVNADDETGFQWAYRYWNIYTDADEYYYEYDGVSANDYMWASYQFIHESSDFFGNTVYTDTSVLNTYTYIHEFGHVLGADDYYDTSYTEHPLGGHDIMDAEMGDHNPYTKFNYGWLTNSRLVTASESVTLTLEDFSRNGDTIIIANDWDDDLGVYQEYYVLIYYTNNELNSGDGGYFKDEGIVMYHVNATLSTEVYDGVTYYDVKNNNTHYSNEYGTTDNLIEFVPYSNFSLYTKGSTSAAGIKDDHGDKIAYTFKVDNLTATTATITFTKNA